MNNIINYCVSSVYIYIIMNNYINDNIDVHIPNIDIILKNKDIDTIFDNIIKNLEIKFPSKDIKNLLSYLRNSLMEKKHRQSIITYRVREGFV